MTKLRQFLFYSLHLLLFVGLLSRMLTWFVVQWTGCDTNPANAAGEGTDQTDRSNIVQISSYGNQKPLTNDQIGKGKGKVKPMFDSAGLRNR